MLTGESEAVTRPRATPSSAEHSWSSARRRRGRRYWRTDPPREIAALTGKVEAPPSPLALELQRIVRIIATMALGIGALFFILSLLVGISWRDAFLFAIGVTVALVPEGLLPTVTLSLAIGRSGWPRATPSCAASRPSRPSAPRPSSAPTRPAP